MRKKGNNKAYVQISSDEEEPRRLDTDEENAKAERQKQARRRKRQREAREVGRGS